jgi:hypothetical protein
VISVEEIISHSTVEKCCVQAEVVSELAVISMSHDTPSCLERLIYLAGEIQQKA